MYLFLGKTFGSFLFYSTSWVGLHTILRSFLRIFHWIFFFFSCFQVWRWLYNSGTNSRVQPWPKACPGVLWTCLSGKRPQRETPEHAPVPASIFTFFSGQDIQHPLPEQKETPHRRLLCFSDNTWPSKLWMSKQMAFSGWRFPIPVPHSHYES